MAAVEALLYCGDRPGNDYGSTTALPWTDDDVRIRLNLIARAWIASRTPRRTFKNRPGGAYRAEFVRLLPPMLYFEDSDPAMYMAVVVQ